MPIAYNSTLADKPKPHVFRKPVIAALTEAGIHTIHDFIEEYDSLPARTKRATFADSIMNTHAISMANPSRFI